jgi:RimJ/RimL family protein N-acetyltransferase
MPGVAVLLRTPRLSLVTIEARHLAGLRMLWTDPRVMANVGFPQGLDPRDLRLDRFVSGGDALPATGRGGDVHLAVEDADAHFLGEAKLGAPDEDGVSSPDVKLLPAWWGRGYGGEVVAALVSESFRSWPACRRVRFTPNVENHAAQALYRRAGARVVGAGHDPPGSVPLRGFVGVRYLVLEVLRPEA